MEKKTYSITEAAKVLGISKSYMYMLVKEQKIPVLELGTRKLIPIALLEQWIQDNIKVKR